jgi:hypothetical protein
MKKLHFPKLAYNAMTLTGAMIAAITAAIMFFMTLMEATTGESHPYLGIFVYMVLPPVLLIGLILIPVGMLRMKKRIAREGAAPIPRWPLLDLNITPHRNAFFVFVFGTVFFALVGVVGGYHAYHFTESVKFCGEICHGVMKPEHVAYQNSPHARVACSECHVGTGANWYVKSKLSGAYQVYAVMLNKYPRPIPTPVKNLRPAQETCEQCHWPEKFFGAQQKQFNHYMYDEGNTNWQINMLIKTGGGDPKTGQTAGIHWHMNIGVGVEYIARDERRQDIPWIRVTDHKTGRVTIYQDEESPLTEEEITAATPRAMDCMDCHNRPSHSYHSPDYFIDRAILTGQISSKLPGIKQIAVEAVAKEYETEEAAIAGIAEKIVGFYKEDYTDEFDDWRVDIDQAITAAQHQFTQNIFPEMKVRWSDYIDNIGHFIYKGCMRCHEGQHTSKDGWTLTRDCRTCHTILAQGGSDSLQLASTPDGLEFSHPEDIGEEWRETGCYECHSGVQP